MAALMDWLRSWFEQLLFTLGFASKQGTIVLLGLDNAGKTTLLHRLKTGRVDVFAPTERAHEELFRLGGVDFRAWDLGGHETVRHMWRSFFADAHGVVFLVDSADRERLAEAEEELSDVLETLAAAFDAKHAAQRARATRAAEDRDDDDDDEEDGAGGGGGGGAGAGGGGAGGGGGGGVGALLAALPAVPVAVLLNKRDLTYALPVRDVLDVLELNNRAAGGGRRAGAGGGGGGGGSWDYRLKNVEVFPCSVLRGTGYEEALRWIASFM
jgi:signal recognition particle receptor subunit beta